LPKEQLVEIGRHITFTEERADDAEEELKTVLILQMLSGRIGDELDCVVTGLANFGLFVRSKKYGIEGFVQIPDLGDDHWRYDAGHNRIVGMRSGVNIFLGLPMKVRIVSVNVPARQLNVVPVEPLTGRRGRRARRKKSDRTGKRFGRRSARRRR
jgi:ribonuclease R